MVLPAPEDQVTLNVFGKLATVIQEEYWKQQQISIYGLTLFKTNLPFDQVKHAQFLDEEFLWVNKHVESEWPSSLAVDETLIHIVVRPRCKSLRSVITSVHRTTTPSPKTEFEEFINRFNSDRLKFIERVRAGETSSYIAALPKDFRNQQDGPDYINIGRPADKVGLPIVLYYPVFGHFLTQLQSTDLIEPEKYLKTRRHFPVSQKLHPEDTNNSQARDEETRTSLRHLLGDGLLKVKRNGVEADGVLIGTDGSYLLIMEMKNEIGMGPSDPTIQAAQSYTRYWSDAAVEHWLGRCCCPSILIGVAGPWMCVLGAIFLDRPIVQPLTDFLWVGKDQSRPLELGHIARVFHCIRRACEELQGDYRRKISPPPDNNTASPFPYLTHYLDSTGQTVHFAYRRLLCPQNPENPIFLAETISAGDPQLIVVKSVHNYNADAHRLLALNKLAPDLLYDGTMYPGSQPEPNHSMIVMEFCSGHRF